MLNRIVKGFNLVKSIVGYEALQGVNIAGVIETENITVAITGQYDPRTKSIIFKVNPKICSMFNKQTIIFRLMNVVVHELFHAMQHSTDAERFNNQSVQEAEDFAISNTNAFMANHSYVLDIVNNDNLIIPIERL